METFKLLESFGLHDGDYLVLENHFERLAASASVFQYKLPLEEIKNELANIRADRPDRSWKVRLLLDKDGYCEWQTDEIFPIAEPVTADIASSPINSENVLLYHKTTNRYLYNKKKNKNIFDTLLWNENGEITEFTIGNIVVRLDGSLYTPPVRCGLLNGTLRRKLVSDGTVQERILHKEDIRNATDIWLVNSVRKWIRVHLS
ncbi:aminotransferase class IV [Aciduricibacillus chroicocephali]|uniref:Aminotransferase class IV n=1 Tax=Aciduricibacillus chroicocephali TaxID=3054939 RepID=A0ABY9KXC6_9BACI|nr:aminotransferase class IV [Bacillaceae bacterium 44XB]